MANKPNLFGGMSGLNGFSIEDLDAQPAAKSPAAGGDKIALDKERYKRTTVALSDIIPNPDNMFSVRKDEAYGELLANIIKNGFDPSQALKVKPIRDGKYMLLSGERRWTAAKEANLAEVPIVIDKHADKLTKSQEIITIFRDNDGYRDKNIFNAVAQIRLLVEALQGEGTAESDMQEILMQELDRSQRSVQLYMRLLQLPPELILLGKEENLINTEEGVKILSAIQDGADAKDLISALQALAGKEDARKTAKVLIERFCSGKRQKPKEKPKKTEDPIRFVKKINKSLSSVSTDQLLRLRDEKRKEEFRSVLDSVREQLEALEEWFNEG